MQSSTKTSMKFPPAAQKQGAFLDSKTQLERAEKLRQAGKLPEAQRICEALLKSYPNYVGALHTLGLVLADRGELKKALMSLTEALSLNPQDPIILVALSTVYVQLDAYEMASKVLEEVLQKTPDDSGAMVVLGEVYLAEKEYERAAEILQKAIILEGQSTLGRLSLAGGLIYLGRLYDAADILEELAERDNPGITTLYQLSQLPADLINVDILTLLESATPTLGMDRQEFESIAAFTKAAALNNAGRQEESWQALRAANRAKFAGMKAEYRNDLAKRKDFLARARQSAELKGTSGILADHPVSLFIFGPSRSGKTSLERLVGTLGGVKRGYENPILNLVAKRTFQFAGLPTRNSIVSIPPGLDDLCRKLYLEELHERAGDAVVFSNTHPGGIFDAYRLAILIPNARFAFLKRDIDDIIYRMFGKLYRSGNNYSYDLDAAREYVQWYYDSIDEMNRLMPEISTVIRYEEMIEDPEAALSSVAALCGLEPDHAAFPDIGDDRGCAEPFAQFMR